ncbi:hypothetical protein IC575_022639 [Cucumis melo]
MVHLRYRPPLYCRTKARHYSAGQRSWCSFSVSITTASSDTSSLPSDQLNQCTPTCTINRHKSGCFRLPDGVYYSGRDVMIKALDFFFLNFTLLFYLHFRLRLLVSLLHLFPMC